MAVILYGLVGWVEFRKLEKENFALRTAIERSYRTVIPSGAIVDTEKQLRRQLSLRGVATNRRGFVSFLDGVTEGLSTDSSIRVGSVNFSQQNLEMRVSLTIDAKCWLNYSINRASGLKLVGRWAPNQPISTTPPLGTRLLTTLALWDSLFGIPYFCFPILDLLFWIPYRCFPILLTCLEPLGHVFDTFRRPPKTHRPIQVPMFAVGATTPNAGFC